MTSLSLSDRVQSLKPSQTIAVTNRARELRAAGKDVIGLGVGEPDFDTPEHIKQAAIDAIHAGHTKYTPEDGIPALKQAVCDKLQRENSLQYAPNQVLISAGAKHSIFNLLQALINPEDEVVIPTPCWVSYPEMVGLCGGKPVLVHGGMDQRFRITPEQLDAAITPRTRLVMLNSPSNPTGAAYTHEELAALGAVLERHPDVIVASDDIYEHILWSGMGFANILSACPNLYEQAVIINGVSKAYAMTGWRIGYAAASAPLIAAMRKIQSQSTSNPTSISQHAAVAALNGDQHCVQNMVAAFYERHNHVVERLNRIRGIHAIPSDGTFYSFPDCSEAIAALNSVEDDIGLAEHILNEAGVALVPGSAFGGPGHLRLSYATDLSTLDNALDRLEKLFGTR